MATIKIEQLGGIAGIGDAFSALERAGEVDDASLDKAQRAALDELFKGATKPNPALRDGISFRITRTKAGKAQTVVVDESDLPQSIQQGLSFRFK